MTNPMSYTIVCDYQNVAQAERKDTLYSLAQGNPFFKGLHCGLLIKGQMYPENVNILILTFVHLYFEATFIWL